MSLTYNYDIINILSVRSETCALYAKFENEFFSMTLLSIV